MMIDFATQQVLERFEIARAKRTESKSPPSGEAVRDSIVRHAAVVHQVSIDSLAAAVAQASDSEIRAVLATEASRIPGASDCLYTLRLDARRRALGSLGTRAAMKSTLMAVPDPVSTPIQTLWEAYLMTGQVPEPASLGYEELMCLYQMVSWVEQLDSSLPPSAKILELVRRRSVLASVEHLVAGEFVGREKELRVLRNYVGLLAPEADAIRAQLARWTKWSRRPALLVHGPGGVGKSALLGQFLAQHATKDDASGALFAYLAFDQQLLRVEDPYTLLVEAVAQLELQAPEHSAAFSRFRDDVRAFRDVRGAISKRRMLSASRQGRVGQVHDANATLYQHFIQLISTIGTVLLDQTPARRPVVIVLDTFEEVQYRDRESLSGFWRMVEHFQREYAPLRFILCGRSRVQAPTHVKIDELALDSLSIADSTHLLHRLGVESHDLARVIAAQVGGNPLTLRLAAGVALKESLQATSGGITGLNTRQWLFFQIDQALIQGQLYRRILDHIHDDDVRALAHPGMVLRRIDLQVILQVLGPICLPGVDELRAERILEELAHEHSLVARADDGALIFRSEVRQAVVRLLSMDRFEEVKSIHRKAIEYYRSFSRREPRARAEEMYHRLALDEDPVYVLDERWRAGIEGAVVASVDEYSDRALAWLSSRVDLEVSREVFAASNVGEWERNITRKVQRALSLLEVDAALELLSERDERTEDSPLFALEAKAHMLKGNYRSASELLQRGVEFLSKSANPGRLAEAWWLAAQAAVFMKDPLRADASLARAEAAITSAKQPLALMQILVFRLALRRGMQRTGYSDSVDSLRSRLNEVVKRSPGRDRLEPEVVLRLAADELEEEYPQMAKALLDSTSLDSVDLQSMRTSLMKSENLMGLDEFRSAWEREIDIPSEAAV